jgi:hypothetical protein
MSFQLIAFFFILFCDIDGQHQHQHNRKVKYRLYIFITVIHSFEAKLSPKCEDFQLNFHCFGAFFKERTSGYAIF